MEREKRNLIKEKADAIFAECKGIAKTAKDQGDTVTAYAYTCAGNAVLKLMMEILTLDAEGLI